MSWTINDEIKFIKGIGTHAKSLTGCDRLELLKKYIETMNIRDNWDKIDVKCLKKFIVNEGIVAQPFTVSSNVPARSLNEQAGNSNE